MSLKSTETIVGRAEEVQSHVKLIFVFIIVGATVGTYALNAYALARADSSIVAIYIYVQPIVTATGAWWVLGRVPEGHTVFAGVLIAAGVALCTGLVGPGAGERLRNAIKSRPPGSDGGR
jgi:uncharacterized membrane protein